MLLISKYTASHGQFFKYRFEFTIEIALQYSIASNIAQNFLFLATTTQHLLEVFCFVLLCT